MFSSSTTKWNVVISLQGSIDNAGAHLDNDALHLSSNCRLQSNLICSSYLIFLTVLRAAFLNIIIHTLHTRRQAFQSLVVNKMLRQDLNPELLTPSSFHLWEMLFSKYSEKKPGKWECEICCSEPEKKKERKWFTAKVTFQPTQQPVSLV